MPKVQRIPEYSSAHLLIISLLCFLFSPTEPLLRRMQTRLSFIPEHVSVHFLKSEPFFSATPQYPPTRKINIDLIVLCKLHAILKFHQFFLITLFRVKEEGKKLIQNQSQITCRHGLWVSSDPLMSLASWRDESHLYIDCPFFRVCYSLTMGSGLHASGRNDPEA